MGATDALLKREPFISRDCPFYNHSYRKSYRGRPRPLVSAPALIVSTSSQPLHEPGNVELEVVD